MAQLCETQPSAAVLVQPLGCSGVQQSTLGPSAPLKGSPVPPIPRTPLHGHPTAASWLAPVSVCSLPCRHSIVQHQLFLKHFSFSFVLSAFSQIVSYSCFLFSLFPFLQLPLFCMALWSYYGAADLRYTSIQFTKHKSPPCCMSREYTKHLHCRIQRFPSQSCHRY